MIDRIMERSKTSGRNDDNLEILEKRFDTFENETLPIVELYEKRDKLFRVDANRSIEAIFETLEEKFREYK